MAGSLQDQLLKAGLASKQQANQAKQAKRKKTKQQKSGQTVDDQQQQREQLEAARQAKAARDRELNMKRQQEQAEKATLAEVRQLIEAHRVSLPRDSDLRYNFAHGSTIRHLYVDPKQLEQLARGQLRIACYEDVYSLIPGEIAERVEQRLPNIILPRPTDDKPAEDDPYADYAIPDDLMW